MPPGPHRNRPAGWARCTRPCTSACSAARRTGVLSGDDNAIMMWRTRQPWLPNQALAMLCLHVHLKG